VSSGDLLALNKYVANSSWWSKYPESVKSETTINGKVYAVNHGENTEALYYNVPMFKKAGIPVPWQPHNWQQIYSAAAKIHAALPNVTAFFAAGGTAPGVGAIQYNASGNMLQGSTNPTIYDQKTHKWVVDSSGIRETLGFYLKLAQNGWQNPTLTEALSPNVVANAPGDLAKGNIAIAVGSNYYGTAWVKSVCGPCWSAGATTMAVAKIPTKLCKSSRMLGPCDWRGNSPRAGCVELHQRCPGGEQYAVGREGRRLRSSRRAVLVGAPIRWRRATVYVHLRDAAPVFQARTRAVAVQHLGDWI